MIELKDGQQVVLHGTQYTVRSGINFRSSEDAWYEYELVPSSGNTIWLSVDDGNNEYAIYHMCYSDFEGVDYQAFPCDSGTAIVISSFGSDCDDGESVRFEEYESPEDGKIYAIERWSDETEYSIGVKIDLSDIEVLDAPAGARGFSSGGSSKVSTLITVVICAVVGVLFAMLEFGGCSCASSKSFDKCIDDEHGFKYETSLTSPSTKEKADIYSVGSTVDAATKNILTCMDGDVKDVMQSSIENNDAVSMIDAKKYVMVYRGTNGKTLAQISSRKFAYANDTELYEADADTKDWYQLYYHERAYKDDMKSFSDTSDGYRHYHSSHVFIMPVGGYNYNSYNNTLRQQSAARRSGSGSHRAGK